jgi:hypothetical protein
MGNPAKLTMRSSETFKPTLSYCLRAAGIVALAMLLLVDKGSFAEPSSAKPAVLSGISYDHCDRTVSIVLHLNDQRPFTLGRADSGLYVDIENARLSPQLQYSRKKLPAHSLIQVSVQQLRKDTARVILHFDAIARLQAAPLKNPSRILVEIDLPEEPTSDPQASASFLSQGSNDSFLLPGRSLL